MALLLASPRGVVPSESDCDFVCSLAISEEAEQAGKLVLKKNQCAKEVYCMQIQISFEKDEPVDQNKPMFVIFSYLFILLIWSKP